MSVKTVCVIGAGPSGITAAKNLMDAGLDVTVLDRGAEVGGNWVFDADSGHSSVFETTHIISSKRYSEYADYPMPDTYPDYPSHAQLAAYFRDYAQHFGVDRRVRFGTTVVECSQGEQGTWRVCSEDAQGERAEEFDALVVANGHHWSPRWPEIPGEFGGEYMHSHDFKRAAPFAGKRVLVIGGGNSACDVAVETARVAEHVAISWRRGYWIVPKFVFGMPSDVLHNQLSGWLKWLPSAARFRGAEWILRLMQGRNRLYGLPEPDHRFGETHPTVNSELFYALRHGQLGAKPDVARFLGGRSVEFVDGTVEEFDAVVACTGFRIAHPFLLDPALDFSEGPVPLYLKMLPASHERLYFIGLFQPLGCIWPAAELQSKIMARHLTGQWSPSAALPELIRRELATPDVKQLDSPRHTITVDFPAFRRRLLSQLPSEYVSRTPMSGDRRAG